MTREQIKAAVPVLQAFAVGKSIQWRDHRGQWVDVSGMQFDTSDSDDFRYRIKPEPREWWFVGNAGCGGDNWIKEYGELCSKNPNNPSAKHLVEVEP